ncbi:hypothetical protein GCM10010421_09020 [Streptomyces glaucus]|uniref:3-hydroxybutyryl-CoA dehydrogenase reduced Rossmann-fold domain-containing protein n=1 Tax=Streptomyces glaucus TaxID=284029 RepID=A0ABN3JAQ8_9ACTN
MNVLVAAGIPVERVAAAGSALDGMFEPSDGTLPRPTDGRTADRHARRTERPVVLFDLSLDFATSSRTALAVGGGASDAPRDAVVGLFQLLGKDVGTVDDVPGLLVSRTVARRPRAGARRVALLSGLPRPARGHQGEATGVGDHAHRAHAASRLPRGGAGAAEREGRRPAVRLRDEAGPVGAR